MVFQKGIQMYIKPKEGILKKLKKRKGVLIWEPVILLKYETRIGKREIITDALIPKIINDPISTALLSRSAKLFKITKEPFNKWDLSTCRIDHHMDPNSIVENLEKLPLLLEDLSNKKEEKFTELKDTLELNVAWNRYRTLFIHSEKLAKRKQSVLPYLKGEKPKGEEYLELVYLESIVREGLAIPNDPNIMVSKSQKLFYPLYLTSEYEVFEVAWKKDKSIAYTNYFREKEVEKIVKRLVDL